MKITKEQYEEIEEAREYGREEFHGILEEYAGIVAKPYTAFDYYDNCGNYVGNSDDYDLKDLLNNAYIEVEGE